MLATHNKPPYTEAMKVLPPNPEPTVANVRRMFKLRRAGCFGWAGFRRSLMEELGVKPDEGGRPAWDVPQTWQDAYKRACGR